MHSRSLLFLVFLGLLAYASAKPFKLQKRSSFKVERVANTKFTGHNGPRAMAKAYRKFRMPLPDGLTKAIEAQKAAASASAPARRNLMHAGATNQTGLAAGGTNSTRLVAANSTGLVAATPEPMDIEYLAPVSIAGQTVNLDFDSGSSDLWVFSSGLAPAEQTGHRIFDFTASQTFQPMRGAFFEISYGDGSGAAGVVGTDVVTIGGATVNAQAVELATKVSAQFVEDQNTDGLLGLAFSSINTIKPQKQKTFFDNLMPTLAEPVFTADLRKGAVGAYEFGRIDNTKFTGQMTWIPVNSSAGFWQFGSERFAVNGGAPQAATPGGQAIADTGTTLILADANIVAGYYSQVPGAVNDAQAGGFVFPCNANTPDLDLDVGGVYMARVKGADINFVPLGEGSNMCFGGLQATAPGSLGIYGDIFFKSQFVAFNGGNSSLGMAPHI